MLLSSIIFAICLIASVNAILWIFIIVLDMKGEDVRYAKAALALIFAAGLWGYYHYLMH